MTDIYSSQDQLQLISSILRNYIRLPVSQDSIPGAFLEGVLAHVRGAQLLNTYDYIDILQEKEKIGWSIKSTKETTPVTWKRAKIPGQPKLIEASQQSPAGLQILGDAIIEFCNAHAIDSYNRYQIEHIGYSRLVMMKDNTALYFEKILSDKTNPNIFEATDFTWAWSKPKVTVKKEQLPALHGTNRHTGKKWWAWHGLGENQLHFSGERNWWPKPNQPNSIRFVLPEVSEKISFDELATMLGEL